MDVKPQYRFNDRRFLSAFADEFLVVCPRCAKCATVTPVGPRVFRYFGPYRLLCPACAYHKEIDGTVSSERHDRDWFFGELLWLRVNCAGGEICAYNYRHLTWLEGFVRATFRDNKRWSEMGWSNQSAAGRLPMWIKSHKNRQAILAGIAKLKRDVKRR